MIVYDNVTSQPWFIILMLLLIFGAIVLAVIMIKKYAKPFQNDEKPKSEKEIAAEEVKRVVVDVDEETAAKMDEAAKELNQDLKKEDPNKPSEEEAVHEEVARATRPVEDKEAAESMARYAEEHPEEAAALKSDDDKK